LLVWGIISVTEISPTPGIKCIENSIYLLDGKPRISLGKTSGKIWTTFIFFKSTL